MEITERREALKIGQTKYFTGRECINGHVAERYALSGACAECLAASVSKAREMYAAAKAADPAESQRRAFTVESIVVKEIVPLALLPSIRSLLEAFTLARFPSLAGDRMFKRDLKMTAPLGGRAIVSFLVHRDDEPTLRALCRNALDAPQAAAS